MEKLLQKNYFLHQSAKDGFRSYLQAYASYSLKKIFDVNKLDLAKVGKAFGFAVPPRVNLTLGGSQPNHIGNGKRRRVESDIGEESDVMGEDMEESTSRRRKVVHRDREKEKREETLGKKKVQKEVFRKGGVQKGPVQWSR